MEEPKIYDFFKPVETKSIKAKLEWENTALVKQLPFKPTPPFISFQNENPSSNLQTINTGRAMRMLSKKHGRSVIESATSKRVVFGSLKNPLGSIDWKGGVVDGFIPPRVEYDQTSPFLLRVRGLKDSVGIETMKKASKLLPELGLPTEAPVQIYKLEEIPTSGGEAIPTDEWKKSVINDFETGMESIGNTHLLGTKDIKNYLLSNDFYLVERATQVPERVWDLDLIGNSKDLKILLKPVFEWVNACTQAKNSGIIEGTPKPIKFDVNKDEDVIRYFDWLSEQIGTYLGRMHGNGSDDPNSMTSGYAHPGNWSLAGTIYDLDSFEGLKVSGENPESTSYSKDVKRTIECFHSISNVTTKYTSQTEYSQTSNLMKIFATAYFGERLKSLRSSGASEQKIMDELHGAGNPTFPHMFIQETISSLELD